MEPVEKGTTAAAAGPDTRIPWYLWCSALAVTSAYVGGYWDIAWHRSIGRDSFWSPPHIAIYACGVLAGLSSAYLILSTTFLRDSPFRHVSVRIWGFSGPLGSFAAAWGGLMMLASAPFDNWWHNAYGLDVRIISPPHMVLAAGFFGIELGTILLTLAFMNRASGPARVALRRLFLYVAGVAVCESLLVKLEYISRSEMHSALFYAVVFVGTPALLTAVATASHYRWTCIAVTSVYTAYGLALLWIFPFVPAEPKLGPVYRQVTHLIPWEFPLLLVVPALVADLILQRTSGWRPIARAFVIGAAFFGAFIAVQWPFANFLMSPYARNWVFGTTYFDYNMPLWSPYANFQFVAVEATTGRFWITILIAAVVLWTMLWVGLRAGRAMERVRR
jgi:hypothetical protein